MSGRIYLLTEGVHDVYFLGKILRESLSFKKNESFNELEADWKVLIPRQFPLHDSLRASMPVPSFYRNAHSSVAVVNAEGIDQIKSKSAFLKPGKPIQTSIEDHRWVGKETLALPRMAAIEKFLLDLVGDVPTATTS